MDSLVFGKGMERRKRNPSALPHCWFMILGNSSIRRAVDDCHDFIIAWWLLGEAKHNITVFFFNDRFAVSWKNACASASRIASTFAMDRRKRTRASSNSCNNKECSNLFLKWTTGNLFNSIRTSAIDKVANESRVWIAVINSCHAIELCCQEQAICVGQV